MSHSSPPAASTSGRSLLVLLVLAAAAVAGWLLLGNPFGGSGDDVHRASDDAATETLQSADAPSPADGTEKGEGTPGLQGAYGAGDLGAVRLRLLKVPSTPVEKQKVKLVARSGQETEVVSGADGVATFPGLAPSKGYRIDVSGEGFAAITLQGVVVKAKETTDLGDVFLGANVVLSGRVVNVAGAAVPDAVVQVFTPERSMALDGMLVGMISRATAMPTPVDQATSDADGRFALANLPEGVYRLTARKPGFATRYESDVTVAKDRMAKALRIVLSEAATAKGKVSDESGKPVAGVRILAIREMGRRFDANGSAERETARTDEQGRYVIETLARGAQYRFGAMADGYAPIFDANAVEVEIAVEKDFTLLKGGAIAGTVKDKASGAAISDALVVAIVGRMPFGGRAPQGGEQDRLASGQVRTDAEGHLRIENLLPGPVSMATVKASGFVPQSASLFTGGGWGEVTAGQSLEVQVTLERGGGVEGTLLDGASGKGIPGATVGLFPTAGGAQMQIFATGSPSATTDAEGKFKVDGVPPGKYGFFASAKGYASPSPTDEAISVTVPEGGGVAATTLKLIAAGVATGVVTDSKGEPVAGAKVRVRQAPTQREGQRGGGRGGPPWRQFLPGAVSTDLTDQNGRFWIDGIASGEKWVVSAENDDYVPADSEPFEVGPGEEKEVAVVLQGGGAIHGRVVDDHGRFVAGARVRAGFLPPDQATRPGTSGFEMDRYLDPKVYFSDADGHFLATNLRAGRTLVKVEKEGFVTWYRRDVTVRADETLEGYTASLSRGEVVDGVVKGANGRAVEGAMVAVSSQRNPGPGSTESTEAAGGNDDTVEPMMNGRTDAEGKFKIENVLPGKTYSVLVWFAQGWQAWGNGRAESAIKRDVSVPARDLEFRLEEATEATPSFFPGGRPAGGGRGPGGGNPPAPPPPPQPNR